MQDKKAVALHYSPDLPAPFIAARGRGHLAERILEIARREGIPLRDDRDLTEVLFTLDVGSFIPEDLYQVIAEIYAFVVEMQGDYAEY